MNQYTPFVVLDAAVCLACLFCLQFVKNVRASHPAPIYIVFHVIVFSVRLWAIAAGSPTTFLNVQPGEIKEIVLIADLFLAMAFVGWIHASHKTLTVDSEDYKPLRADLLKWVSYVGIPIGLVFMARYLFVPDRGLASATVSTSYQTLAIGWPGLLLLALIYRFGFRIRYLLPLAIYIGLVALQADNRVRAIIPLLLAILIALDRRRRRWPTAKMFAGLLLVAALFYPLDQIGTAVQQGTLTTASLRQIVGESTSLALKGNNPEQHLLDMAAAAVGQSDAIGEPQYGKHYLDVLFLPIPRPWWPDKPRMNENLVALSTTARPLSTYGTVMTVPGESYIDFRWLGVGLIGLLFGAVTGRLFSKAYVAEYGSAARLLFLTLAACWIQILRDGLMSVFVFYVVYALPILVLVFLNHLVPRAQSQNVKVRGGAECQA